MKRFKFIILSSRDFFSFVAGIIVSGYVVELSLNPENTRWHWITIILGLLIGLFLYIIINICKNFEDHIIANKANKPSIGKKENEEAAWESINNSLLDSNKVFGFLPRFWLPIVTPAILFLSIGGGILLDFGNREIQEKEIEKVAMERVQIITEIDSLNSQRFKNYMTEIKLLQDSLEFVTNSSEIQKEQIDSLEIVIRSLEEGQKK